MEAGPVGKDAGVTRELKLALIVGLSLVLVVGVLITDHVKKSDTASIVAPMTGDDPSRLTTVGNNGLNPFVPVKPLPEPEPKQKTVDPVGGNGTGPVVFDQTKPGFGEKSQGDRAQGDNASGSKPGLTDPNGTLLPAPTTIADTAYAIQSGDTLYSICKKQYGDASLHGKLAEYNKLTDGKALKLNQKVNLPAKDVLTGKALPFTGKPAGPVVAPKPITDDLLSAMSTTVTYKVASGDSLSSIARKSNTSLAKIRELNPSLRGREDTLAVGDELKLPKPTASR